MKMALDRANGVNAITAYRPGRVEIGETGFERSLIVLPAHILSDWEPTAVADLRATHFRALFDYTPEVLILGTGETQQFPEPRVFTSLIDLGIGFEVMDNAAACRTYNILLAEDRRVALALLFATN